MKVVVMYGYDSDSESFFDPTEACADCGGYKAGDGFMTVRSADGREWEIEGAHSSVMVKGNHPETTLKALASLVEDGAVEIVETLNDIAHAEIDDNNSYQYPTSLEVLQELAA